MVSKHQYRAFAHETTLKVHKNATEVEKVIIQRQTHSFGVEQFSKTVLMKKVTTVTVLSVLICVKDKYPYHNQIGET